MTETEINKFKVLLTAKREEVVRRSPQREDIVIVRSNDDLDNILLAGEREFAVRTLERDTARVMEIGAALERIEDGEFGVCLECEEPISPKRLAAVPWAALCLHCQEMQDARRGHGDFEQDLAA